MIAFLLASVFVAFSPPSIGLRQRPADPGRRPSTSYAELRRQFANPPMEYAPFAFWFWDAPVDARQAAAMAREMARQRLNPGYAHPRAALGRGGVSLPKEEWLSDRWFDAFGAALREAERAGALLGYCDEYMWPSGQAAGRVLAARPDLRACSLRWSLMDLDGGAEVDVPDGLFAVAARIVRVPAAGALRDVRLGRWIWHPDGAREGQRAWFRTTIDLPETGEVSAAVLRANADNTLRAFVNGTLVGEWTDWRVGTGRFDVGRWLRPGRNVLAIEASNADGPAGLIAGWKVALRDGRSLQGGTDASWRCSIEAPPGWESPAFAAEGWSSARELGPASVTPWSIPEGEGHVPAVIQSASLRMVTPSERWTAPAGRWRLYVFEQYHHPGIDGGQVNYLDERLMPVFIGIAHEPYARRFGREMGRSLPGVFVDNEGDYGYKLAWSQTLAATYARRKQRDIRLWMPLLVDEDEEGQWARARWDWFDAVSEVYCTHFLGGASRWLAKRGAWCISNLWEESLLWQAAAVGDFFRAQRSVTMPGNDCLVRKALEVHDFKETQSVTEFEGRRFMSEVLGVAGWSMDPILMKQAVNAVTAWGVSHIVPHGIYMTRQFDGIPWPPDWYNQNPYWPLLHHWTDFARRASFVNAHGHTVPDVLLMNPMDSIWVHSGNGLFDADKGGGLGQVEQWFHLTAREIDAAYSAAINVLTDARTEFLVADRHYLDQMRVSGGTLVRGPFRFGTVVVPPCVVLSNTVARKLVAFARGGGRVVLMGRTPDGSLERGMGDPEMASSMATLRRMALSVNGAAGLRELLAMAACPLRSRARFDAGPFPMLQLHRRIDGRDFWWLANNTAEERSCRLRLSGARGRAEVWDCESGVVRPAASRDTAQGAQVALRFRPYEAFWLVLDPARPAVSTPPPPTLKPVGAVVGTWTWRIDPARQPKLPHPLALPAELTATGGAQWPLGSWNARGLDRFSGWVEYETRLPWSGSSRGVVLDLGRVAHMAAVEVNGRPAGSRLWPPFRFDVGAHLRPGTNCIRVRVGNLLANNMGETAEAGLFGPVRLLRPGGAIGASSSRPAEAKKGTRH